MKNEIISRNLYYKIKKNIFYENIRYKIREKVEIKTKNQRHKYMHFILHYVKLWYLREMLDDEAK